MKRILVLLLSLLLVTQSAMAAQPDLTDCAIANGAVTAAEYVDLVAPYSGTLLPFAVEAGDEVKAGEQLFEMMTTTIYATEPAEVKAVYAGPGSDAMAVMSRYGGLIVMQPELKLQIAASVLQGYNSQKNRYVDIGESLYLRSERTGNAKGEAIIVGISGTDYIADVVKGEFVVGESMNLYRDDDYESRDSVGRGVVTRRDPLLAAGQGRVAEVFVNRGDTVAAGTPLLTLMSPDASPDASPLVSVPANGVIGQIAVAPGQQVWKGQVLARLMLTDQLEVTAQVDEIDLNDLWIGDEVYVVLDTDKDWIIEGEVTEISRLGTQMQNASYYTVHIAIDEDDLLLGASASVYIPQN